MASHSSATEREETPHVIQSTETTVTDALRRRALHVINDNSIDAQSRAMIRYGLEINDPWLAELVRRAEAGESVVDSLDIDGEDPREDKVEALAEMICRAGDEPAVGLLVLMAMLEMRRIRKHLQTWRSILLLLAALS